MNSDSLVEKQKVVEDQLRACGRVIVAFSGGVDSTLLAKLARDVLGKPNVLAVTADSPSFAREDLEETKRLAGALDLEHAVIDTKEVERPEYRLNTEARCYFCKHTLFEELEELARARGFAVVLYGVIGDDHPAQRPGHRAAGEHGVRSPLAEADLSKWEVRELARELGLPNWDKPQNACLSSRIPHGQEVTETKLRQVETAERTLRAHRFRQVRVRHTGRHARIEVGADEVARFNDPALCGAIERQFEAIGFETVGVDRAGYHEGGADHTAVDEVPLGSIGKC